MHKDFADWYRIAVVEPEGEMLKARWEGIVKAGAPVSVTSILEVVRLFYDKPLRDPNSLPAFQAHFKETDPAFRMKGNKFELQILAGTTLIYKLENSSGILKDLVALAMLCAAFQKKDEDIIIPDLVALATSSLRKRSASLRNSQNIQQLKGVEAEEMMKMVNRLVYEQRLRQEESDMLWWLFGERSRDLNQNVSKIGVGAPIIVGKELGDLVLTDPGPLQANAFLSKMLQSSKASSGRPQTLQKIVNATPREWREKWMGKVHMEAAGDLCPIMLATKKSIETKKATEWIVAFKHETGIDANTPIEQLDLAIQVYRECLLFRSITFAMKG